MHRYTILNDGSAYASPLRLPPCGWETWREYVERLSRMSSVIPGQRGLVAYATCHTLGHLTNMRGGATYNRTYNSTYNQLITLTRMVMCSISSYVLFAIYSVVRSIFLAAATVRDIDGMALMSLLYDGEEDR